MDLLRYFVDTYHPVYDAVIFVLALVAIFFAVRQLRDSTQQLHQIQGVADDSKNQLRKIEAVASSMSTRFIGKFPDSLADIKDVAASANRTLDIMLDYAGYGHYSQPTQFGNYLGAIVGKPSCGVTVRLLLYDDGLEQQSIRTQFVKEKFDTHYKVHSNFLRAFPDKDTAPKTYEEFIAALLSNHRHYRDAFVSAGVKVRTMRTEAVMFLWIEDAEDTAFSFRVVGQLNSDSQDSMQYGDTEVAFRTRDGYLISTLSQVFEKAWKSASPLPVHPVADLDAHSIGSPS